MQLRSLSLYLSVVGMTVWLLVAIVLGAFRVLPRSLQPPSLSMDMDLGVRLEHSSRLEIQVTYTIIEENDGRFQSNWIVREMVGCDLL